MRASVGFPSESVGILWNVSGSLWESEPRREVLKLSVRRICGIGLLPVQGRGVRGSWLRFRRPLRDVWLDFDELPGTSSLANFRGPGGTFDCGMRKPPNAEWGIGE